MKRKITRRQLTTELGALAGGAAMLGPGLASALVVTPAQTEGPFYPPEPHAETDVDLTMLAGHTEPATGDVVLVRGRVTNSDGVPLANVRVDIWQANHRGRYSHPDDRNTAELDPNFQGIGIAYSDENGYYGFRTIMPGAYPLSALSESGWRARHIHFKIFDDAGHRLTTQMYFEGDPLLEEDRIFLDTPEDQRHLLVTRPVEDAETGLPEHRFDIVLA